MSETAVPGFDIRNGRGIERSSCGWFGVCDVEAWDGKEVEVVCVGHCATHNSCTDIAPSLAPEVTGSRDDMGKSRGQPSLACTITSSFYMFLLLSIEFWMIFHSTPTPSIAASVCFQSLPRSIIV